MQVAEGNHDLNFQAAGRRSCSSSTLPQPCVTFKQNMLQTAGNR